MSALALSPPSRSPLARDNFRTRSSLTDMSSADVLDPAIAELLSASDGLLVLAKGLGMPTVLRRVVEACLDGPLAFLLNTDAGEARELQHAIALRGGTPPVAVTAECGAAERAALYRGGGVLIVCEESDETEAGSTAIVIAWLLARRSVPWAEVQAVVSDARPSATLNANFEKQLRVWTGWKEFPGLPEWI